MDRGRMIFASESRLTRGSRNALKRIVAAVLLCAAAGFTLGHVP